MRLVMLLALTAIGALACAPSEPASPPGAASRPAMLPKHMANVHDVVAYVEDGQPKLGTHTFQTVHEGGLYYFASRENLDAFKANPDRYMPAFGGWCACGMAKGMRLEPSGEDFEVVDGRLFLFHDDKVEAEWKQDTATMIGKAEERWKILR